MKEREEITLQDEKIPWPFQIFQSKHSFYHQGSPCSEVLFWSKSENLFSLEIELGRVQSSFPDIEVKKGVCVGQCSMSGPQ